MTKEQMIERVAEQLAAWGYSIDTVRGSRTHRQLMQWGVPDDQDYSDTDVLRAALRAQQLMEALEAVKKSGP